MFTPKTQAGRLAMFLACLVGGALVFAFPAPDGVSQAFGPLASLGVQMGVGFLGGLMKKKQPKYKMLSSLYDLIGKGKLSGAAGDFNQARQWYADRVAGKPLYTMQELAGLMGPLMARIAASNALMHTNIQARGIQNRWGQSSGIAAKQHAAADRAALGDSRGAYEGVTVPLVLQRGELASQGASALGSFAQNDQAFKQQEYTKKYNADAARSQQYTGIAGGLLGAAGAGASAMPALMPLFGQSGAGGAAASSFAAPTGSVPGIDFSKAFGGSSGLSSLLGSTPYANQLPGTRSAWAHSVAPSYIGDVY